MLGEPIERSPYALSATESKQGTGAELTELLVECLRDGQLVEAEVFRLAVWLDKNRNSPIPAVGFLLGMLERLGNKGATTTEGRQVVTHAAKTVLPPEWFKIVQQTGATRGAREAGAAEAQQLLAQQAVDRERYRNVPLREWEFIVAGCRFDNRQQAIESIDEGDQLVPRRDRNNRFSRNAIALHHPVSGAEVGMVRDEFAQEIAPMLDAGHPLTVTVKLFREYDEFVYPVVVVHAYPLMSSVQTLKVPVEVRHPEFAVRTGKASPPRENAGCLIVCITVIATMGLSLIAFGFGLLGTVF